MEEMICDFIKDESGLWWFIGCRAFKQDLSHPGKISLRFFTLDTNHLLSDGSDEDDDGN